MSDFDVRFVLWLIFRACMFNKGKMVRSQSACDINEVDCSTNTRAFGGGHVRHLLDNAHPRKDSEG